MGLQAHQTLTHPLEQALEALATYRSQYRRQLREAELAGLDAAIRALAITVQTVYDRARPASADEGGTDGLAARSH